jgi:hypothetical protein
VSHWHWLKHKFLNLRFIYFGILSFYDSKSQLYLYFGKYVLFPHFKTVLRGWAWWHIYLLALGREREEEHELSSAWATK